MSCCGFKQFFVGWYPTPPKKKKNSILFHYFFVKKKQQMMLCNFPYYFSYGANPQEASCEYMIDWIISKINIYNYSTMLLSNCLVLFSRKLWVCQPQIKFLILVPYSPNEKCHLWLGSTFCYENVLRHFVCWHFRLKRERINIFWDQE